MLSELLIKTPLINLESAGRPDIYVKAECMQFGGSFKSRGIISFLNHLDEVNGLITYTTGNHGIAIAAIAKELQLPSIIIISNEKLSSHKRLLIESLGGSVNLIMNKDLDEATGIAIRLANELNYTFVPLYDNEELLFGYSQIATEILTDFNEAVQFYLPIGSGSLLIACARLAKSVNPANKIIGVEPEKYQRLNATASKNRTSKSIADGLSIDKIPMTNLDLLNYVDSIETLSENEIIKTMRLIRKLFDNN